MENELLQAEDSGFSQIIADLPEDVQRALENLYAPWDIVETYQIGADWHIRMEDAASCRLTLVLENAENIPCEPFDFFRPETLTKDGDKFQLSGTLYPEETNDTSNIIPCRLQCTGFHVNVQHFSAMGGYGLWDTPWDYLQETAKAICYRSALFVNDRERELLPLAEELSSFTCSSETKYPVLTELLQRHGCKKGVRLLSRMEKCQHGSKRLGGLTRKLLDTLNQVRYEPIFREIYGQLLESQAEYPTKAEALCPPELLQAVRSELWQRLEQYGYAGSYPTFRRKKFLPGIHLAESYGVCYWAGMKRNTRFYIHCEELLEGDQLRLRLISGTAMLRRGEKTKGIFSCLFNAKGRRFFHSVDCTLPTDTQPPVNLAQSVKAAVKKAGLRPLSRKEKKEIGQTPKAGFGTFLTLLLVCGGLFALGLVGTLTLTAFGVLYWLDGLTAATNFLLQYPWWAFFAAAWVLFGLPIAAMTVAARNK